MVTLFVILWLLSGWLGFIVAWTRDFDYTHSEASFSLFCSLAGPFLLLIDTIQRFSESIGSERVLIKKRKQ